MKQLLFSRVDSPTQGARTNAYVLEERCRMAAPALLRELIRGGRKLRKPSLPLLDCLINGGVVRSTTRSKEMAAMQRRLREVTTDGALRRTIGSVVRGCREEKLDDGFRWLRRFNEAARSLEDLAATGAATPRRAEPPPRYTVGSILYHKTYGKCAVYGWEATSAELKEATNSDYDADIVDNRAYFSGIDQRPKPRSDHVAGDMA